MMAQGLVTRARRRYRLSPLEETYEAARVLSVLGYFSEIN
jgi:hypothetical protein